MKINKDKTLKKFDNSYPCFIEFCKKCDRLVQLLISKEQLEDEYKLGTVYWPKCLKESNESEYNHTLFGNQIEWDERKRDIKNKKKINEEILDRIADNSELSKILECSICDSPIDLQVNLQWMDWLNNYCFDWLIFRILTESTCPNWDVELTKEKIRPNKEWNQLIKILNVDKIECKDFCESHRENYTEYWNNWDYYLWDKWICIGEHENHKIQGIDEAFKKVVQKTVKEISNNKSAIHTQEELIKNAINNSQINKKIIEIATDSWRKKLEKISEEETSKVDDLHFGYIEKIRNGKKAMIELNENMQQFIKSKEKIKISEAYKNINDQISFRDKLRNDKNEFIKQCKMINMWVVEAEEYKFWISSNEINELDSRKLVAYSKGMEIIEISFQNDQEEKEIDVFVTYESSEEGQYFIKMEVTENKFIDLEDKLEMVASNSKPTKINKVTLKGGKNEKNEKIKFKLLVWKFNDKINQCLKEAEDKVRSKMLNQIGII